MLLGKFQVIEINYEHNNCFVEALWTFYFRCYSQYGFQVNVDAFKISGVVHVAFLLAENAAKKAGGTKNW